MKKYTIRNCGDETVHVGDHVIGPGETFARVMGEPQRQIIDKATASLPDIPFGNPHLPKEYLDQQIRKIQTEIQKMYMIQYGDFIDTNTIKRCDHDWKQYFGLVESYEYCAKCDEKRNKE